MPKISIILTSLNHEKYICESIDSVLAQTFTDFELIIWDDASSDNSWPIIKTYSDSRIKTFRNDECRRAIYGVNKTITEIASGEYIAFQHSDDVWEKDKLEKQVEFLAAHPEIGAVFTNALAIGEDGKPLNDTGHYYSSIFDQPNRTRHEWLNYFFYHGNALCHPSVLIRKRCYSDCGTYRYGFAQVGDFDMWIRLCLKYEIHVLQEKLVRFRVRANEANTSGNRRETRVRGVTEFYQLFPNYLKLDSFDEFVKVFPEAESFYRKDGFVPEFVLAMLSLEPNSLHMAKAFGSISLFNLLWDNKTSEKIKELYHFDYRNIIELTGKHDIFSLEAVANLGKIVTERDEHIKSLAQAVADTDTDTATDTDTQLPSSDASEPEAFFTICSKNFLAHARVLYNSVRSHYPKTQFFVVLCDRLDGMLDPAQQPFEFVYLEDLNMPNLGDMAARYNITEFNTAVKPFAFSYLMEKHGFSSVIYVDPDLLFVDRMHEIDQMLTEGVEAILTPHILQPAEHDEVHDRKILLYGIYNLGFLALRNTPSVRSYLAWWGRRLERDCTIKLDQGIFVDQKWADLLPAFVPGARVIHHPGYNVAYWNLPQRRVTRRNDQWFVNDQPLRFVHFSGNRIDDPKVFSRHSQQVTIENIGDLGCLLDNYREQVFAHGHEFYRSLPYAYNWNGEAGINLHTPDSLDMSTSVRKLPPTVRAAPPRSQITLITKTRVRIDVLTRALPVARRLSGGWVPLARRAWGAYRRNGLAHLKAKSLELSSLRAPPELPLAAKRNITNKETDRLLYLDWAIPKPDQDAASVTSVLLMRIFQSLGYAVTFIPSGLKYEEGYYEALVANDIEVLCYPHIESIEKWLSTNAANFDICVVARGPVVWPYPSIIRRAAPRTKLIFNTVDLHYLRELRQAELTGDEEARTAALLVRDHELDLIRQCDLTILLSSEELYVVRAEVPEAPLTVLPIVFENIPGATKAFEDRRDILFIGSFPHLPNIDAVIYFAQSIFPLIQKRLPGTRFKVVGANPPEHIQRLAENPDIEVLGFVKDLQPLFEGIRLSVAPLRYGAGIKGKIGSSLCYGVPCIATTIAVEGMGLVDGRNVLTGDTPEAFADAVCRAYTDKTLWHHISSNGCRFALENYSYDVIRERVRGLIWSVRQGWRAIESAIGIDSWSIWQRHQERMKTEYSARMLREQALLPMGSNEGFLTPGFCCVCDRETEFFTSFMYSTSSTPDGRTMPNWREHMQCKHCALVNRMRAALNALHTLAPPSAESRIYLTEQITPMYRWLQARYPNMQGSEYLGSKHEPGAILDGIRHEDVMRLSFPNASFDRVLSFDVLEHLPDPKNALREIYRVLDKDGVFLFTVPFSSDSPTDIIRATLNEDGSIEHHLPAEYHDNPIDPEGGALCFRYFGWELLDELRKIGFNHARILAYWSEYQGYLWREQYLFIAHKPFIENTLD
ncbi:Glycosyltransferase involved in cell wall bisynthesis [Nitrosospira sp. Nsp18]|uniref:glycosyltransferase n=1 Tax=Nitrosospira sp. Nsp18 TaxID=1855334 RepID=UPI00088ED849|nr:glycosyltransferase [Nitrosospira sp. Nsp18]SDA21897.1 Glycosyltransferase involved in cell wall bisynthesis [Nitrosospira sp. Nsp18]